MYFRKRKRKKYLMFSCYALIGITFIFLLVLGNVTDSFFEKIRKETESFCYEKVLDVYIPNIRYGTDCVGQKTVMECVMDQFFPVMEYVSDISDYETQVESELSYEVILEREGTDELVPEEDTQTEQSVTESTEEAYNDLEVAEGEEVSDSGTIAAQKQVEYSLEKLNDFDYLIQNFYSVDSTTTITGDKLNASSLLGVDMSLTHDASTPQILIYHTHSQEGYVDSTAGDTSTTVVGVGEYLAQILREQYGYSVIHDTGEYDVEDRDAAYTVAAPALEQILAANPGIEVVIDIHRDGVASDVKTTTNINGTEMAKIMFFNGLSHTTAHGDIAYLYNPYLSDNLAFSFQMQLAASEYYPDFAKKIYLKGYRYNMHYRAKSTLIEVGNQNNTFEEAKNAMVPLADVIDKVIGGT